MRIQIQNVTFDDIESALFALDLAEKASKREGLGLCYGLYQKEISQLSKRLIEALMAHWPGRTGRHAFPVPPGCNAYEKYARTWAMWSRFHPYGRARRRMVKWIRQQLEAELERLA